MTTPSFDEVHAHAVAYPFPDGGGLWRITRDGGILLWPLRAHDGRVEAESIDGGYWGAPPADCQWEPCDQHGNPLALLAERDRLADECNKLRAQVADLAGERDRLRELVTEIGEGKHAPEYHHQGIGLGLENEQITDRYQAGEYGWRECARQYGEYLEGMAADMDGWVKGSPL